jgi:hypothetical protein
MTSQEGDDGNSIDSASSTWELPESDDDNDDYYTNINLEKEIDLFNCGIDGTIISECSTWQKNSTYPYKYGYNYKCGTNKLEQKFGYIMNENIYLKKMTHNMFINNYSVGRYGNYIYGAIFMVFILLICEEFFMQKNYEETVEQIKLNRATQNSKLYSKHNCKIIDDYQSKTEDTYQFKRSGIESFKYFDCHHFNSGRIIDLFICIKDVDFHVDFYDKLTGTKKDFILYVIDEDVYLVTEGLIFVEGKFIMETINENIIDLIANSRIRVTIKQTKIYSDIFINLILEKNSNQEKQLEREIVANEIRKIYLNKRFICIISLLQFHPKTHYYIFGLITKDSRLIDSMKKIIFEDTNNHINTLYQSIQNKYRDKKLIVSHFRGGDFELYENHRFYVLKPIYYTELLEEFFNNINDPMNPRDPQEYLLLCTFHPNDYIFYIYMNIIKNKFPSLTIIDEDEIIKDFPNSRFIFSMESKHVYFMSLFDTIITSNSTYSMLSSQINTKSTHITLTRGLKCYGNIPEYWCGMNYGGNYIYIDWKKLLEIFFCIYIKIVEENDNSSGNKKFIIVGPNSEIKSIIEKKFTKDKFKIFAKHVISYDGNKMSIINNNVRFKMEIIDNTNYNVVSESMDGGRNIYFNKYEKYNKKNKILNYF